MKTSWHALHGSCHIQWVITLICPDWCIGDMMDSCDMTRVGTLQWWVITHTRCVMSRENKSSSARLSLYLSLCLTLFFSFSLCLSLSLSLSLFSLSPSLSLSPSPFLSLLLSPFLYLCLSVCVCMCLWPFSWHRAMILTKTSCHVWTSHGTHQMSHVTHKWVTNHVSHTWTKRLTFSMTRSDDS